MEAKNKRKGCRPNSPNLNENPLLQRVLLPLFFFCASGTIIQFVLYPLLFPFETIGGWDWTQVTAFYEAARISVIDYGQYPWWNPFLCCGFPLEGYPNYGMISLGMLFTLVFGALVGSKLLVLAHFIIGLEGGRRLTGLYTESPFYQYVGGLIFCLNGAFALHAVVGHANLLTALWLPWLCYFTIELPRSKRAAIGLGLVTGLSLLQGIHYASLYSLVIVLMLGLFILFRSPSKQRFLIHSIGAAAIALAISGFRIGVTYSVFSDFPRVHPDLFSFSFRTILKALVLPLQSVDGPRVGYFGWWELGCYFGLFPLLIFIASAFQRIRWYHVAAVVCFLLAFDSANPYLPGYWFRKAPLFSSLFVVMRWRLCAALFVAIGVAEALASLRLCLPRRWCFLPFILAMLIVGDLVVTGAHITRGSIHHEEEELLPAVAPAAYIQNAWGIFPMYPAVKYHIGSAQGYMPLLGYDRDRPTMRRGVGHPGYSGELYVNGETREYEMWSPNRFVVAANTGDRIVVNTNPSTYWYLESEPLFPGAKVAELQTLFEVVAPKTGKLVFEIRPQGLRAGLLLQALGFILSILWWGLVSGLFSKWRNLRTLNP